MTWPILSGTHSWAFPNTISWLNFWLEVLKRPKYKSKEANCPPNFSPYSNLYCPLKVEFGDGRWPLGFETLGRLKEKSKLITVRVVQNYFVHLFDEPNPDQIQIIHTLYNFRVLLYFFIINELTSEILTRRTKSTLFCELTNELNIFLVDTVTRTLKKWFFGSTQIQSAQKPTTQTNLSFNFFLMFFLIYTLPSLIRNLNNPQKIEYFYYK